MDLAPYSSPNKVRVQTGFAARLTSTYSSSTGYSWEMLVLSSGQSPKVKRITGPLTGRYAFTPDDNQVLTVGTKGWIEPDPQGRGYIFLRSKATIAADCAWVAGITTTDCLMLTIVATSGACSGVDDDQEILLEWDAVDSRWESGLTDWTGTGSGGSGPAHFGKTNGLPYLTLDGEYLTFLGCEDDGLLFAGGGAVLCGGTSDPCDDYFVVRVECIDCPPVGWDGEGWYCVNLGRGCPGEPMYLPLSDLDLLGDSDVICSGPYATPALAAAACPGTDVPCGGVSTSRYLCAAFTNVTGANGAVDNFYVQLVYYEDLGIWYGEDGSNEPIWCVRMSVNCSTGDPYQPALVGLEFACGNCSDFPPEEIVGFNGTYTVQLNPSFLVNGSGAATICGGASSLTGFTLTITEGPCTGAAGAALEE